MQLSFATTAVPELSLTEVIALAGRMRYQAVEVQCWPRSGSPGVTHIDVAEFNADSARRIRELLQREGIALSALACVPATDGELPDGLQVPAAHLHALVDAAHMLEVPRIITCVNAAPTTPGWSDAIARLGALASYASHRSVVVCLEHAWLDPTGRHPETGEPIAPPLAWWEHVWRNLPSPSIGLSYEPLILARLGVDEVAPILALGGTICQVRATDSWPRQLAAGGGLTAAQTRVRWDAIIAALGVSGFTGPITVRLGPELQNIEPGGTRRRAPPCVCLPSRASGFVASAPSLTVCDLLVRYQD